MRSTTAVLLMLSTVALVACGGGGTTDAPTSGTTSSPGEPGKPAGSSPGEPGKPAGKPSSGDGNAPGSPSSGNRDQKPPLRQASCPAAASNCRSAEGTILYVERVDPDGDGDAHFVLLSRQSVTAPGISVIDVERSMRPHPLPVPGDRVSAAGPVYRGSYGQRQIEATELFTAPG